MTVLNFENIADYLADKGIKFAVKTTYNDNGSETISFVGLTITKIDQFFRCNGVVISGNIAKALIA